VTCVCGHQLHACVCHCPLPAALLTSVYSKILTPDLMLQGALTALLLAGFGAMWQFDLFRRNNFGLLFFLFFLFQVSAASVHRP
jgi:hypothetical protein